MKRAIVVRGPGGVWRACVTEGGSSISIPFPTHAEALAHGLASVGLTPTNPTPMEAP